MSFLPSHKASEHHDRNDETTEPHDIDISAKSGAKPEELLNVSETIRAPSPNPSLLSVDDIRFGRNRDHLPVADGRRCASRSPAPQSRTLKEKINLFWITNKGLVLVLFSQLFGTLMNVTTRKLEIEGNDGGSKRILGVPLP
jgi:hypothetical protein